MYIQFEIVHVHLRGFEKTKEVWMHTTGWNSIFTGKICTIAQCWSIPRQEDKVNANKLLCCIRCRWLSISFYFLNWKSSYIQKMHFHLFCCIFYCLKQYFECTIFCSFVPLTGWHLCVCVHIANLGMELCSVDEKLGFLSELITWIRRRIDSDSVIFHK